jgi:phosphinothricin acetyltransferase
VSALEVVPAGAADVPAILAILNDAIRDTTAVWYADPKSEDEIRTWWETRTRDGFPVLVARRDGAVVGYATYGPFRAWPGYRATVELSIYVTTAAQRTGVGRTLLAALMDRARADGLHAMVGGIEAGNEASLALHRELGFREVARMPEVGQKFGRWLTLVFMQAVLDQRPLP